MTNTTNTALTVDNLDPDTKQDYTTHTVHFNKAKAYTYNYTVIDKVLIDNYATDTAQSTADLMREPVNRLRYRVARLQKTGVLEYKYDVSETAKELRRLRTELKTVKAQLKAVA